LWDVAHVYPCASGTFAVELALRAIPVLPGEEVVLAGYDFPGNFRAVEAIGATPVLIDIERRTCGLDLDQLAQVLAQRPVRAVIASHLHGGLADMATICRLAHDRGAAVIEDACQATGAFVQGRRAGTWGDTGVLSFGGSKLLTAGRGGVLLTPHAEIHQRAKIFCERGNHAFPLSELQAAVLLPQIERLDERNRRRAANVRRLRERLRQQDQAEMVDHRDRGEPSYYKVAWYTSDAARATVLAAAAARGIELGAGFPGFFRRGAKRCVRPFPLPSSQRAAQQLVLLHHPMLLADEAHFERFTSQLLELLATKI
jgi:dTDP-4-amino-4,6-dideoxygalactose transaminase